MRIAITASLVQLPTIPLDIDLAETQLVLVLEWTDVVVAAALELTNKFAMPRSDERRVDLATFGVALCDGQAVWVALDAANELVELAMLAEKVVAAHHGWIDEPHSRHGVPIIY